MDTNTTISDLQLVDESLYIVSLLPTADEPGIHIKSPKISISIPSIDVEKRKNTDREGNIYTDLISAIMDLRSSICITFLFGINLLLVVKVLGQEGCLATKIEKVDRCPQTKHDWDLESKKKLCPSMRLPCLKHNFEYHCLANTWLNETYSICAIPDNILGNHCAEYNIKGKLVQPNYYTDCRNFSIPCPIKYLSTLAYKYQECYKLVNKTSPQKETSDFLRKTKGHKDPSSQNKGPKYVEFRVI
ncbi:uncharacterized protein LOC134258190 [Saccostrea cucullata]|uniref:uncharacterized protein LOC134258190 n=1 Tax=Saccostrea cuccullata TaxID=36930 RepID=UPI002ED2ABAE